MGAQPLNPFALSTQRANPFGNNGKISSTPYSKIAPTNPTNAPSTSNDYIQSFSTANFNSNSSQNCANLDKKQAPSNPFTANARPNSTTNNAFTSKIGSRVLALTNAYSRNTNSRNDHGMSMD
jgi:hypothetical protein